MDLNQLRLVVFQQACTLVHASNVPAPIRARCEKIVNEMFDIFDATTEVVRSATNKTTQHASANISGIVRP